MADLKAQVNNSAEKLREASTGVQSVSGTLLPATCYEYWIKKANYYKILAATADLFPVRDTAWEALLAVTSDDSVEDADRNLITHGSIEMDFSIARHLALTSYVAVTWSIYDRLTNVCGRLAGISKLAENDGQNPNIEVFIVKNKEATIGFGIPHHIQQAYAWPLKVSYKVRNWLVHEGYDTGGTPLFVGNRISDGFKLHPGAITSLQKSCKYSEDNGKIGFCCLQTAEECWPSRDLLTILDKYHAEIDTMFTGLLLWSVDSFVGQIAAFAERDNAILMSAAAGSTL